MLTIFAPTEFHPTLEKAIAQVHRLDELVDICPPETAPSSATVYGLRADAEGIQLDLNWNQALPPFLMPANIPYADSHLLGLIFHLLGNDQEAWNYLQGLDFYPYLEGQNRLRYGIPFNGEAQPGEMDLKPYPDVHNLGVIHHYGLLQDEASRLSPEPFYRRALELTGEPLEKAFTAREWATWCLDRGDLQGALAVLGEVAELSLSDEARTALQLLQVKIDMQRMVIPIDQALLEQLKQNIWDCLKYYEAHGPAVQAGLLLLDATHIALISESYSEGLGYAKRAIELLEAEDYPELAGNAHLKKATLLYTWAQQGNPQFYRAAVDAYQQALQVFTKAERPDVFAEIHHQLAVLYSEMPSESKRRGIWAGVSSASFQEALEFYTRTAHPYEYASICNNYGNALTKYPAAIHSDNYEKALHYYNEALSIRTPDYPYERALTLLNYLEASWKAGNVPDVFNYTRYEDMLAKANEVKRLVTDAEMQAEAERHLDMLAALNQTREQANA